VRQLVQRARSAVRMAITSLTPYPVLRWLTGSAGSAPASPREVMIATAAAGAGGVVAKLGIVAAAGAIAASGFAAAGHQGSRPRARADRPGAVARRRPTAVADVTRLGTAAVTAASGAGESVTAPTQVSQGAGRHVGRSDESGSGHAGSVASRRDARLPQLMGT